MASFTGSSAVGFYGTHVDRRRRVFDRQMCEQAAIAVADVICLFVSTKRDDASPDGGPKPQVLRAALSILMRGHACRAQGPAGNPPFDVSAGWHAQAHRGHGACVGHFRCVDNRRCLVGPVPSPALELASHASTPGRSRHTSGGRPHLCRPCAFIRNGEPVDQVAWCDLPFGGSAFSVACCMPFRSRQ